MKPGGGVRLARLLHARTNDALEILLLSHRDLLRPVREHPPPAAKPSNEGTQVPNPRIRSPLPPHRTFAGKGLRRLGAGCRRSGIVQRNDEKRSDWRLASFLKRRHKCSPRLRHAFGASDAKK